MVHPKGTIMHGYYDIAVAGGGIAGVAAALQSARMGMQTVLIEKTALVGGRSAANFKRCQEILYFIWPENSTNLNIA